MTRETAESILGGYALVCIAALPIVNAFTDWPWEFAAWIMVGLMLVGATFYALTHRERAVHITKPSQMSAVEIPDKTFK